MSAPLPLINVLGDGVPGGAYLLRLLLKEMVTVRFGRFQAGRHIIIPAGDCLYLGSALGRGAAPLGWRLVRHATRTDHRPPHAIRAHMLAGFPSIGLGSSLLPAGEKKLFWHIDYLLDEMDVELTHVFILRTPLRLEAALADMVAAETGTSVIAEGLGATDSPGHTHLLRVTAGEAWWHSLPQKLSFLLRQSAA